jgi:hypothetical protein
MKSLEQSYLEGHHEAVWNELVAMGNIAQLPIKAEARSVAAIAMTGSGTTKDSCSHTQ